MLKVVYKIWGIGSINVVYNFHYLFRYPIIMSPSKMGTSAPVSPFTLCLPLDASRIPKMMSPAEPMVICVME